MVLVLGLIFQPVAPNPESIDFPHCCRDGIAHTVPASEIDEVIFLTLEIIIKSKPVAFLAIRFFRNLPCRKQKLLVR
jgi:hypothetical protein